MKQTTREKIIHGTSIALAINPLASLDEIADAAGVGTATLYRHFESRQALMRVILLSSSEKMDLVIEPIMESDRPAREKLDSMVRAIIPLGANLKVAIFNPFYKFLPEYKSRMVKINENMRKFSRELKHEGVVAQEIPEAWIAASIVKLIYAAWENIQSGNIALNDAPDLVLRTFLNGNGPANCGRL